MTLQDFDVEDCLLKMRILRMNLNYSSNQEERNEIIKEYQETQKVYNKKCIIIESKKQENNQN